MSWLFSVIPDMLVVVGIAVGGYLTFKGNKSVTEAESKASPYEALASRVVSLEESDKTKLQQINQQEIKIRDLRIQVDFQERRLNAYTKFYEDLHNRWDHHRSKDTAPTITPLWFNEGPKPV